ncbi:N-acetylmuramoyl-L-alanine amidase [Ornithinimicrobium sp. Arc0846-15]|nr:N-acetylmuramoyl-L-alanine amidase [Ornithinimicrobium laminariae]
MVGTFEDEEPTFAQVESAAWLIAEVKRRGFVDPGAVLVGHRDSFATACPGDAAYAHITTIRALADGQGSERGDESMATKALTAASARDLVMKHLLSQRGYTSGNYNWSKFGSGANWRTKWGTWQGYWCNRFLSWGVDKALGQTAGRAAVGLQGGLPVGYAATWLQRDWFRSNNRHVGFANAEPGDYFLLKLPGRQANATNHVGIFVRWKVEGRIAITLDGNLPRPGRGTSDIGVHYHERTIDYVVGVYRPDWAAAAKAYNAIYVKAAPSKVTRYVSADYTANVRSGPGTNYKVVTVRSRGRKLTGTLQNGWLKIGDGQYVGAGVLSSSKISAIPVVTRYVSADAAANVRATASAASKVVDSLERGTKVTGLLNGSWVRIGRDRFVSTKVLSKFKPPALDPAPAPAPTPEPATPQAPAAPALSADAGRVLAAHGLRKTTTGVSAYQKANGLQGLGVVGPKTTALFEKDLRMLNEATLGGATRHDTAVQVSKAAFPEGTEGVYLVGRDATIDAAIATRLPGAIFPVASPGQALPAVIAAEIARLKPLEVVRVGGQAVVPDDQLIQARSAAGL